MLSNKNIAAYEAEARSRKARLWKIIEVSRDDLLQLLAEVQALRLTVEKHAEKIAELREK